MNDSTYLQRVKQLILRGIYVGTEIAFVLITISVTLNALIQYSSNPALDRFSYAIFYFLWFEVSNIVVFLLGVMAIGLILPIAKSENRFRSKFLGLAVSILFILAINYLLYLLLYPPKYGAYTFLDFLFLPGFISWWEPFFGHYLTPNIINIGVLTYLGWNIGDLESIQPNQRRNSLLAILASCILFFILLLHYFYISLPDRLVLLVIAFTFFICWLALLGKLCRTSIKVVLSQKEISTLTAIYLGFLIGVIYLIGINFLLWVVLNSSDYATYVHYDEILVPGESVSFFKFIIRAKAFYLPNFLSIAILLFVGWKTHKPATSNTSNSIAE